MCKKFSFSDIIKQHHGAIECDITISGDTIIVMEKNGGQIRLFEIYPIGKHSFQHPLPSPLMR